MRTRKPLAEGLVFLLAGIALAVSIALSPGSAPTGACTSISPGSIVSIANCPRTAASGPAAATRPGESRPVVAMVDAPH